MRVLTLEIDCLLGVFGFVLSQLVMFSLGELGQGQEDRGTSSRERLETLIPAFIDISDKMDEGECRGRESQA